MTEEQRARCYELAEYFLEREPVSDTDEYKAYCASLTREIVRVVDTWFCTDEPVPPLDAIDK